MAWPISITPEGWADLYRACHAKGTRFLAEAIACHRDQTTENYDYEEAVLDLLMFRQDVLADEVYRLIQQTNSTDAGGFTCWIDRDGYYKVELPD